MFLWNSYELPAGRYREHIGSRLIEGNRVEILTKSGEAFQRMLDAVRDTRRFMFIQFYIYRNDETGSRFAGPFKEKAARGVGYGSSATPWSPRGTPNGFGKA